MQRRQVGRRAVARGAIAAAALAVASIALASAAPGASTAPDGGGDVVVRNDRIAVGGGGDGGGTLQLAGEVLNGLDVPLRGTEVAAVLYSEAGQVIGTAASSTMVDSIVPGMSAPFVLDTGLRAGEVARYTFDVGYEVAGPKGRVIDVTSSQVSSDAFGNVMVTGTVVNNGDITANEVSVVATLYGRDGGVIAAGSSGPDRDYLRASEEAFFLVAFPGEAAGAVAGHAVVAESEEYAAVPEFPLGAGALLAASLFGYIGLSRFWGGPIARIAAAADPV